MHAQRIYMSIWIPSAASATYFPMAFYCYCSLQVQPASSAFLFSRRADRLPREGMQFTLLFIQLVPRCAWHWISEFQLSAEKGKSSRAQKQLWDISVPCVELPCGCSVSALPAASGHSADGTGTSLGLLHSWLERRNRLGQGCVGPAAKWPSCSAIRFSLRDVWIDEVPASNPGFSKSKPKYGNVAWIVPAANPYLTEGNNGQLWPRGLGRASLCEKRGGLLRLELWGSLGHFSAAKPCRSQLAHPAACSSHLIWAQSIDANHEHLSYCRMWCVKHGWQKDERAQHGLASLPITSSASDNEK